MPTLGVFRSRPVGSGTGTVGRTAEQPVFMRCLLSVPEPLHVRQTHIRGMRHTPESPRRDVTLTRSRVLMYTGHPLFVCSSPSALGREHGKCWGDREKGGTEPLGVPAQGSGPALSEFRLCRLAANSRVNGFTGGEVGGQV